MAKGGNAARRRAEGPAPRQLEQSGRTISSSASPPITTCSRATASTATPSASRWRCSSRRAASEPFRIHLTYPIDEIDAERKKDWKKEQDKEKKKKAAGGKGPVRENWSPAKHGLAAFFAKVKLAAGQKTDVVDAKKPHVIDLLEPLGF